MFQFGVLIIRVVIGIMNIISSSINYWFGSIIRLSFGFINLMD